MVRFEEKYIPEPNSGCFLWLGAMHRGGYGVCRPNYPHSLDKELAHRVAWRRERGQIPDGMHVLHRCDVRSCVNPNHLFLGTETDNQADKFVKGRQAKGPKHCAIMKAVAPRSTWHYKSSISDDEVRAIRREVGTVREIAAKYCVSTATACRIRTRKRYAEVSD